MILILGNVNAMKVTLDEHAMNVNPGTEKYIAVFAAITLSLSLVVHR